MVGATRGEAPLQSGLSTTPADQRIAELVTKARAERIPAAMASALVMGFTRLPRVRASFTVRV